MNNILSLNYLKKIGVKLNGKNIKVSKFARIYNPTKLILNNNIRIDDFTILSGKGNIEIGEYVHIGPYCYISSFTNIKFNNFSGLSSGVKLFGSSDNYSGNYLTNPTVDSKYLGTIKGDIILHKHVIIGSGSIVLPNITLNEGTAIGSLSLITKNTEEWKIYGGVPAKIIKNREKKCIEYEKELMNKIF